MRRESSMCMREASVWLLTPPCSIDSNAGTYRNQWRGQRWGFDTDLLLLKRTVDQSSWKALFFLKDIYLLHVHWKCFLYFTNHWAVQEADRLAGKQRVLYPGQIVLGMRLRVGTKPWLDRKQEGQREQSCGRSLWSTLQPSFIYQRVTQRHDLPIKKEKR